MNDEKIAKLEQAVEKLRSQQHKLMLLLVYSAWMAIVIFFLFLLDLRTGNAVAPAVAALAACSVVAMGLWVGAESTGRKDAGETKHDDRGS